MGCIVILVMNAKVLPNALKQVFVLAFQPQAMAGGLAGVTVQQAMRFSGPAACSPTRRASARRRMPTRWQRSSSLQDQGAVAILGVFVDTFVVLTLTGLVLITSGLIPEGLTARRR